MNAVSDAVGQWVRQLARPERLRVVVATLGVLVLSGIASVVLVAEGSTGDAKAIPLTETQRTTLIEAAGSCPVLTPALLAGQIMATTGFEPTPEGGIAGLTAAEWELWKPTDDAVPTDDAAAILALAHLDCDLIGRLRQDGFAGDLWPLAVAAFASSLADVGAAAGVPSTVADFVERVLTYADAYAEEAKVPGTPRTTTAPVTATTTTSETSPTATATPSSEATPSPSASPTAGPVRTGPSTAAATTTQPAPVSLNFSSFSNGSGLYLNGSAQVTGGRLALTTALTQAGSAWSRTMIDPSRSFTTSFSAVISQPTDGLAFIVQAAGPNALGGSGGNLGYGHGAGDNINSPVRPSLAVEIDTWHNGNGLDPSGAQEHVAITVNGNVTQHLVWGSSGFDMRNNKAFWVWVTYDAGAHRVAVYVSPNQSRPAQPLFTHGIDLRAHLGTDRVYVGFTAATGQTNLTTSSESVLSWTLSSS